MIVFNRSLCYYEVYAAHNEHEAQDLLGHHHEIQNRIDFYSKFELIASGYARDVVYHQFKKQFAVVAGFDDKDRPVEYRIGGGKKGLFSAYVLPYSESRK